VKRIRISNVVAPLALGLLLPSIGGCEVNLRVDDPAENPGIPGPTGIIRGMASYVGPAPCFKNGEVEGALVVLLFAYDNPPPPDGLASTALNFATVPGERLFANVARPAPGTPGSVGSKESFCPSVSSPPINAAATWSLQQVPAGRYQVRSFYSRQNRFNPLFNFANLPLAGDVPGGAFENVLATVPKYAMVEIGVPTPLPAKPCAETDTACKTQETDAKAGKLMMPSSGFIREGVSIALGGTLKSNRPFFHIDYEKSVSYAPPPSPITEKDKDFCGTPCAPTSTLPAGTLTGWATQRKKLDSGTAKSNGFITFPQDHLSTSQSNGKCAGDKSPDCDLFQFAQGSFPQIRFKYGFPGTTEDVATGADSWAMKKAKPKDHFGADKVRPYYGIDPHEFKADVPTSDGFLLSRNFNAAGEPDIIRDNTSLETIAQIADIFPSVVLSKLAEDGEGHVALPPRSQTDPIVVIQTIPLKDWEDPAHLGTGSMKATSQSVLAGGGLTNADGSAVDTNHPLYKRGGGVVQDGFTALVRPSVVCIYPQVDLRGTLVTPVQKDPNPDNPGAALVEREKIFKYKGNRVKDIKYGCLPPGHYSVNVVYPTGQAWSFPNLSGHCSYTTRFVPNEDCMTPNKDLTGGFASMFTYDDKGVPNDPFKALTGVNKDIGFPARPLVKSQMLYQVDDTGKPIVSPPDPITGRSYYVPQVIVIKPSPRCGQYKAETDPTNECANDAACANAPFSGVCIAAPTGTKKFCDYNADGKISSTPVWFNNPENEDTALDDLKTGALSEKSGNGLLDPGEDKNNNKVMDLKVPSTCALPYAKWVSLSQVAPDKAAK